MSPRNSEVRCIYCLASNSVPPGNAKCCCTSCGRIFALAKASSGVNWSAGNANSRPPEPPIVATPIQVNYQSAASNTSPEIAAWPWPALSSRSEQSRHKFFTIAARHLLLISLPTFALILTLSIGFEVTTLGLIIVVPLSFVSALAMGLGQTWIVDNFYREGKTLGQVWWIPGYMHFYILTRWPICWRPMGMITLGGAFFVGLLFYLMGDQLGTSVPNNSHPTLANQTISQQAIPQQAKPFDSRVRSSPARRPTASGNVSRNTVVERGYNGVQTQTTPAAPANDTVWSYESLAPTDSPDTTQKVEMPSQPVISPVFEEDDGFREWRNLTGSYKVVAKFDVVDGDFVLLKTREGRKIRVEIAKLSAEDQRFLEPILQSSPFEVVGGR